MENEELTAKNFIKEPHQRQNYQCLICFQVCIQPVRCKGSCSSIFCMKCVSDTRNNNIDRCPNRCSSPFLVTPLPQLHLELYCPYNPTQCGLQIHSVKDFQFHYQRCHFVSQQTLRQKQLQNEYKCLKGDHLQFFIGSYEEMINSLCAECHKQKLCRSFCRICQQFYCVSCRVPPCSKEGCPMGHSFTLQRIGAINYMCDICDISTAVSNGGVYDDNLCNFGLCELCYKKLPEEYDESKPREIVTNINTECSCKTKLSLINVSSQRQNCELCKQLKQCPKQCSNCEKKYCISCKSFDIFSDQTCLEDHQLQKVEGRQEGQLGCMRCSQTSDTYFFDPHCFVKLCESCLVYSMKVTTDKERPVTLTCDKNHVLNYMTQDQGYETCCCCEKTKLIKLGCIQCEQGKQFYCFQCKPIPLRTCYFKHNLKQTVLPHERQCQFCRQKEKKFLFCRKCNFYVCQQCTSLTLNGQKQEMEIECLGESMQIQL